jgi:glutathione synthase/RimK-type ligase-like ATP-grasp enzyme
LIAALAQAGVHAELHPWNGPFPFGSVPLVVCRTPWDYLGDSAGFRSWITSVAGDTALENPSELMRWNLHKSYLVELARAGVPVIETRVVPAGASAAARSTALAAFDELVIKPAVSGGAAGALRGAGDDPASATHLDRLLARGDALVQPFEPAIAAGEVSLVYFGGEFSHAVRKTPDPGDWRVQIHHGGANAPYRPSGEQRAVGAAALAALPVPPLYARIDLVGEAAPKLMEAELIEPELFLTLAPGAALRYARVLSARLSEVVSSPRR